MALDTGNNKVLIGFRHPATLVVLDSKTGKEVSSMPMVSDADDLYYDEKTGEIFISGGGGFVNIFRKQPPNTYKQIANIPTTKGARTSFLVPQWRQFLVAERAEGGKTVSLKIYNIAQ
jgi:hypothetical protein